MNDVLLNKIAIIERCLKRINEVYEGKKENLTDYTKQDSIILNIQRACEASIDIAMYIVSEQRLGVPKTSRDAFRFLQEEEIIEDNLAKSLMNMVGFRNIAVHDYQTLNLAILEAILNNHMKDFKTFSKVVLQQEYKD
ncbi:MAG TPA: DUF86 domain-containing protein [Bacillota bacterium]|nr:DUF86 domain-containing protein [Bacillota bacterium]